MFCQKCGAKLSDNSKFCNSCGNKITDSTAAGNVSSNASPKKPQVNNAQGLVLNSPSAFKDEIGKFNILYYVLCGIAFIMGLINGGFTGAVMLGLFVSAIVYAVIHCISEFKIGKMRKMVYHMPGTIDKETLIAYLAAPLSKYGMVIENKTGVMSEFIRISHNSMQYEVYLYPQSHTFTIWAQEPAAVRFFAGRHFTRLYKRAIISVPVIAFNIQEILRQVS